MYKFAILDTEFTSWKGSLERNWRLEWEKKEIINIACIKFNSFEDVYLRRINLYCRTNKIKPLPIYIQKLTKIDENKLNSYGLSFKESLRKLNHFLFDVNIIFVNGLDKDILIENCNYNKIIYPSILKKFYNLRPVFSKFLKKKENKIISSELFKNNMTGLKPHTGLYDCYSIFNFIKKNLSRDVEKIKII